MSGALCVICIRKVCFLFYHQCSKKLQRASDRRLNLTALFLRILHSSDKNALHTFLDAFCLHHHMMLHNWGCCLGNKRTPPPPNPTTTHRHTHKHNTHTPCRGNRTFSGHMTPLVDLQSRLTRRPLSGCVAPEGCFTVTWRGNISALTAHSGVVWSRN